MPSVRRQAFVEQGASRMFDLVNSVEAYPKWFSWCIASHILEQTADHIVARLDVGLGAFRTWFTTENRLERPDHIHLRLRDGPFRRLEGYWAFDAVSQSACNVGLYLEFEPSSRLLTPVVTIGLQGLADRMVKDFILVAQSGHHNVAS